MKLQITTRHFDMTPEFRTVAEERVRKLKRYFEHIIDVSLILSSEKHRMMAELTLHTNSHDLVGTAESSDMKSSIDQAVEKIENQLRKHKERVRTRKGRTGLGEAMAAEPGPAGVEIDED